jgi:hypothetical protein
MKGPNGLNSDVSIKPGSDQPIPDKITIVIDPISKPIGLIKDVGNGIAKGFKTLGNKIKRAFKRK